jgi:hypothetical protein
MLDTISKHIKNDARLIKQAWDDMDWLSHMIVVFAVAYCILSCSVMYNMLNGRF